MTLWEAEWVDADGTLLEQWRRPLRETVERQAQRWLKEKVRSRVLPYHRRGSTRELVVIVTRDGETGVGRRRSQSFRISNAPRSASFPA